MTANSFFFYCPRKILPYSLRAVTAHAAAISWRYEKRGSCKMGMPSKLAKPTPRIVERAEQTAVQSEVELRRYSEGVVLNSSRKH